VNAAAKMTTPMLNYKGRNLHLIKTAAGFTLLELMLVMAIIAMASVIVIPNLTGLEARTFTAQVRDANSILNYARRIAVVTGQPRTASFFINAQDADAALDDSPRQYQAVGANRWDSYGTAIRFRDSTDREVEVEEKIDITFYPEGGSTGGTLLLSQGNQQALIVVDPFTGRISTEIPED